MPRLEDNSYAARAERERSPNHDPSIKPRMVPKEKKTFGRAVLDVFLSEKIDNVWDYITYSVIGPGLKNLMYEMVNSTVSMIFWGDPNARRGVRSRNDGNAHRAYEKMYDDRRSERNNYQRPAYDVEDFVFDHEDQAKSKLEELYWYLDRYNVVRVADFYTVMDASPDGNFQVNSYGWRSLRDVDIYPTPDGWVFKMPRAISLR